MTILSPVLVLAFVISSLYGLVFYLVFGKGWSRLALYWAVGIAGFGMGQWLGGLVGVTVLNIGPVNLLEGTVVSWASLFAFRAWRH